MEVCRKRRQRGASCSAAWPASPGLRHMTQKTWVARNKSIRCGERHWQVLNASDQSIDSLTVILFGNGCSLKPGENRAIIAISLGESPSWLRHWILIPACEGSNPSSPAKIPNPAHCNEQGFLFVSLGRMQASPKLSVMRDWGTQGALSRIQPCWAAQAQLSVIGGCLQSGGVRHC